ncbi:MAG: PAS domain S-box protein [Geobacteraceae bacterium]|nr:PAS domain S-box protein [Geobacteraceae bacterium]
MLNEPDKEGRFLQIFQLLPEAVFVTRADDSVVIEVNKAFETLTGYGPDSIIGRPALSLFFFLDPDLWTRAWQEIKASGEVHCLKTRLLRKDGRIAFVRMSMRSVQIDGVTCHLATIHDISARDISDKEVQGGRSAAIEELESLLLPDADIDQEDIGRLIDFQAFQDLMNSFYEVTRIGMAITDVKGNVQVATGWQDICTRFHRIHPGTHANCLKSDVHLSQNINEGEYALYKCQNGMWDLSTPIIIGGRHIANLFLGQFLFDDEVPDYALFRTQAEMYGFDVKEYLDALVRVPRWSRELVENVMEFYTKLAMLVSRLSIGNIKFSQALAVQKQAPGELCQANLIVENSPAVLFCWKPSAGWPVEFVSKNVIQFGYSPEVFTSGEVAYFSIIYPDDLENVVSEVAEHASRSVDRFNLEYRIVTREGAVRWVEERTVAKRDKEGELVCYQGIVIDITDRKKAEQELLLAKFCIDTAGIGILHTDEHQIFNANDYACKSLGYTVDELRTMPISDIDPVVTSEKILEIKRSLEATGSATHQTVHRRRDGSMFPVEVTTSAMEFQGKHYSVSFVQDISERKRTEDALRESEEKFRVLAETSPAAIALYQGEEVIYINPTAARLIGYTTDELSRFSFWGCVHDDFKEMVRERGLARMRGEPVPSQYECKFVSKSGKELWAIVSVGCIEYKGKPAGIVTLIDTMEAKLAEEKMRSSLAEKEILLKEVHHRVKNNLQIVSSLLDLQSDYIVDEHSRNFFRDSQNRIRSMALIHQKLYQSESLAFIDMREYIEDLANYLFSCGVKEPGLVHLKVDVGEVSLGMDEAIPCGLIINELMSNSLKHAFPDDREGEITVMCRIGEDGWITLLVSDNGVGLPPDLDFRKTDTLGLQLVAMLVKQLRGRIELSGDNGTLWEIAFSAMGIDISASA